MIAKTPNMRCFVAKMHSLQFTLFLRQQMSPFYQFRGGLPKGDNITLFRRFSFIAVLFSFKLRCCHICPRINLAITGKRTVLREPLITSKRTAMAQKLWRRFLIASTTRHSVWGRPSEVCIYLANSTAMLNFPALFFYSKYFPIWIISDTVHNLYEKNSLMDFWKTNTLTPYNGIQWFIQCLLHCNHLKSTTKPCKTVSNGYPWL